MATKLLYVEDFFENSGLKVTSSCSQALNLKDECTHNHEHRVHSISRKADEMYTSHLRTCMPSQRSYLILLPHVVLTHVLKLPVSLLPPLAVLNCLLPPPVPLLLPLAVLTCILLPLVHLSLPLAVLTCILPPLVHLLQLLAVLSCLLLPPVHLLPVDGHSVIFPERSKKNNSGNWFYFLVICKKFTGHLLQACSASCKRAARAARAKPELTSCPD